MITNEGLILAPKPATGSSIIMVISLRPPGQTEEEEGSSKGEKTETDWLLLSKDPCFSHEGSTSRTDSQTGCPLTPHSSHHAFAHPRRTQGHYQNQTGPGHSGPQDVSPLLHRGAGKGKKSNFQTACSLLPSLG